MTFVKKKLSQYLAQKCLVSLEPEMLLHIWCGVLWVYH
jgi:hypothetical protein